MAQNFYIVIKSLLRKLKCISSSRSRNKKKSWKFFWFEVVGDKSAFVLTEMEKDNLLSFFYFCSRTVCVFCGEVMLCHIFMLHIQKSNNHVLNIHFLVLYFQTPLIPIYQFLSFLLLSTKLFPTNFLICFRFYSFFPSSSSSSSFFIML